MAAACGMAPGPSISTGRRAARRASARSEASEAAGAGVGGALLSGSGPLALSSMLAITGPGGAASAIRTIRAATSAGCRRPTVIAALATDRPNPAWSIRWWLTRSASAGTVSAITTTGSRSRAACAIPLTALASPGPRVTTTLPGTPVRSAYAAAMITAAVSP
jgi:hypothetical protein